MLHLLCFDNTIDRNLIIGDSKVYDYGLSETNAWLQCKTTTLYIRPRYYSEGPPIKACALGRTNPFTGERGDVVSTYLTELTCNDSTCLFERAGRIYYADRQTNALRRIGDPRVLITIDHDKYSSTQWDAPVETRDGKIVHPRSWYHKGRGEGVIDADLDWHVVDMGFHNTFVDYMCEGCDSARLYGCSNGTIRSRDMREPSSALCGAFGDVSRICAVRDCIYAVHRGGRMISLYDERNNALVGIDVYSPHMIITPIELR